MRISKNNNENITVTPVGHGIVRNYYSLICAGSSADQKHIQSHDCMLVWGEIEDDF